MEKGTLGFKKLGTAIINADHVFCIQPNGNVGSEVAVTFDNGCVATIKADPEKDIDLYFASVSEVPAGTI